MKKLLASVLILTMSASTALAMVDQEPLANLSSDLTSILRQTAGRKSIEQIKSEANEKNVDLEIAFQNYLIAKKKVSVARSSFNPVTTGHALGMALGLNYLWASIAVDAVLSIPMKIHGVKESQYLKQAAFHNLNDGREAISNELAKLFYDVLSHEALMKTIDQEIKVLNYFSDWSSAQQTLGQRFNELRQEVLRLQIERSNIYDLYLSELSAIKTLLQINDDHKLELAHVEQVLSPSIIRGLDIKKLKEFALANSHKYKSSVNMHRAGQSNVKAVKWSIFTFDGMSFGFKKRIKAAKNEEMVALARRQSTELAVKNSVALQLEKLNSALIIQEGHQQLFLESLNVFEDYYAAYQAGQGTEEMVMMTALCAIRDFRSKIVSHYHAWSALDDFHEAANYTGSTAEILSNGHEIDLNL